MILQIRHCLCCYYLERWWEVPCPIPASSGSQVVIVSSGHKYSEGLLCRLVYASEEGRGHSFHSLIVQIIEMVERVEESYVSESLLTSMRKLFPSAVLCSLSTLYMHLKFLQNITPIV